MVIVSLVLWVWITRSRKAKHKQSRDESDDATNHFSLKLGGGGFGSVYEGVLSDGTKIAVKRLDRAGQGAKEFKAEVETLGNIHHLNLVRLKRLCAEKSHRMLVYEFLPNGSLDKWIFANDTDKKFLDLKTRSKIALHIARGLSYLHEQCQQRIIHLDIKPQNILLDENFNAKVSDFGLAKLIEGEQSEVITMIRGTPGYMAPELLNKHVSVKADVFSFGIMLVEIVCGKRRREISDDPLFSVLQNMGEGGRLSDLIDPVLEDEEMDAKGEAVKMLRLGMLCIQDDSTSRPTMSIVVKALEGMIELHSVPSTSSPSSDHPFPSTTKPDRLKLSYTSLSSVLSGRWSFVFISKSISQRKH
ncbi:G-type lectin S-receptor-like serine/threonine-protein kinase SD2-5 [Cryptomeria japonica]|uniref:G-type lectin S-receptor-like serine/threonine-protein kinase SD2-5 n=1 Tax=Cryptomeria japonica TaxID=3369 RepID=UPI0027DA34D3|nr:G-type lectin S-receptor-like serine/threonine-protein kinase SD2-5 [Cryptomeria japonica]